VNPAGKQLLVKASSSQSSSPSSSCWRNAVSSDSRTRAKSEEDSSLLPAHVANSDEGVTVRVMGDPSQEEDSDSDYEEEEEVEDVQENDFDDEATGEHEESASVKGSVCHNNNGKELTLSVRRQDFGIMSGSRSPRFLVQVDDDTQVVRVTPRNSPPILLKAKSPLSLSGSLSNCSSLTDVSHGWRKLFECELCANMFDIQDMVSMISCQHQACSGCIKQYLSIQIRERQQVIIQCPFCTEPELKEEDEDGICNYLSLLDQLIKGLLDEDIHGLFQRKVRDRVLMKDPNFKWCPSCSSGFIAQKTCATTVMCPDCQTIMCFKCNEVWVEQHIDSSCQDFAEWKRSNDPTFASKFLNEHLQAFGIDCPNCDFHYELSKGGCMHFHCVQCGFDFCGGCQMKFVSGSECKDSTYCARLGLHAHHPRNCLFYLRDKEPEALKTLLEKHQVPFTKNLSSNSSSSRIKTCPVMEQKRHSLGYKDEACGRSVDFAGLCRTHYIEYLGQLIMKNGIDPIDMFEEYELELVLRRNSVALPDKKTNDNYRDSLIEVSYSFL
jgi:E3 ubiquitin-protein ligase RNF31